MELNNKKIINAWCMYDWANSVYNLVINTAIFPIYYSLVTTEKVVFLGFNILSSVLYTYALSVSYLLSAAILPLLSGIADYTGKKKFFLKVFTFIGAISCMSMFFFTEESLYWGIGCVIFASLGYSSSLVFYDAYLPEIASVDKTDRISAKGYSYGYGGSTILLVISAAAIMFLPESADDKATVLTIMRWVFVGVGIWWIGFAQIPFMKLPSNIFHKKPTGNILLNGYREIKQVFNRLGDLPNIRRYIIAFFFFNMGVQTVMLVATLFGTDVLGLGSAQLIPVIIIIQLIGMLGSYLFARLSEMKGNIFSLNIMIIIWIGISCYAYFVATELEFYIIAVVVGLVMGGIQALSRATYSKLIPTDTEDHTSFFSFFDVTYHVSVVIGTFSFGFINQITGSMRNSTLALVLFFVVGLIALYFVKLPKSANA